MKKPHKFAKQDNPKAKAAQLQKEWEAMLARHSKPLERGAKALGIRGVAKSKPAPVVQTPESTVKSNPHGMMGVAAKAAPKVYTGTKIVGIATMHKSNLVPIFNEEAAVEVAQMRRN